MEGLNAKSEQKFIFMESFVSELGQINSRLACINQRNYDLNRKAGIYEDQPCCEQMAGMDKGPANLKDALIDSMNSIRIHLGLLEDRVGELETFI
jgi:hypothetical protein